MLLSILTTLSLNLLFNLGFLKSLQELNDTITCRLPLFEFLLTLDLSCRQVWLSLAFIRGLPQKIMTVILAVITSTELDRATKLLDLTVVVLCLKCLRCSKLIIENDP